MNYIEKNLQPSEELKYVANLHPFLFIRPIMFLLLGIWFVSSSSEITSTPHYLGLAMLVFGTISLIRRGAMKMGATYVVTNKRVILKTGIVNRQSVDLLLSKCEGMQVKQRFFGRIFNFGTITVTTGGVISSYPFVANPLEFRREINKQIG